MEEKTVASPEKAPNNGNTWKWISAVLACLLVASFFFSGFNQGSVVDRNVAGKKGLDFINQEILKDQAVAQLMSVTDYNSGLYQLNLLINNKDYKAYVTKDGKILFPDAASLEPASQAPVDVQKLPDDDAILGNQNATVTIVEFSDYQCPYCVKFEKETMPQLRQKYIASGKVRFVYRDFPISGHSQAQKAAEAAECAGEQAKYFEMHDKLFGLGVSGGVGSFKQYAIDLGLNATEFNDCLDSGKMAAETQKDMRDGIMAGVEGTPAFFINGQLVTGALPFSSFQGIIDKALGQ